MALHPIRRDYTSLTPDGSRPPPKLERFLDTVLTHAEQIIHPDCSTVVLQAGHHGWRLKLTLDMDPRDDR
jgi:hypothetical protein